MDCRYEAYKQMVPGPHRLTNSPPSSLSDRGASAGIPDLTGPRSLLPAARVPLVLGQIKLAGVQDLLEILYFEERAKVEVIGAPGDNHATVWEHHDVELVQRFMIQVINPDVPTRPNLARQRSKLLVGHNQLLPINRKHGPRESLKNVIEHPGPGCMGVRFNETGDIGDILQVVAGDRRAHLDVDPGISPQSFQGLQDGRVMPRVLGFSVDLLGRTV
jgi:hypothetical protein